MALVLAKMPPASLLAISRKSMAESRKSGNILPKAEATRLIISQWQLMWDSTGKAAWTKRLIPDLARWWYQGPSQVSFHMAQALTNHGCFQKYVWSRKRALSPTCVHCTAEIDDAEHTIFLCPFWTEARCQLTQFLRRQPRPEDVTDMMCRPKSEDLPADPTRRRNVQEAAKRMYMSFNEMVEKIMSRKEELERGRQGAPIARI